MNRHTTANRPMTDRDTLIVIVALAVVCLAVGLVAYLLLDWYTREILNDIRRMFDFTGKGS